MSTFQENLSKYYNWTIDFSNKVIFEYERFLRLKSTYNDIISSTYIDKLWKYHILNVEDYYNYCTRTFGKIINYDQYDNTNNMIKILNTINHYTNTYGEIQNKNIWLFNLELNVDQIKSLNIMSISNNQNITTNINTPMNTHMNTNMNTHMNTHMNTNMNTNMNTHMNTNMNTHMNLTPTMATNIIPNIITHIEKLPSYSENKPDMLSLKLYFIYKNSKSANNQIHKQIVPYKPSIYNETIENLIDLIAKEINIIKNNIVLKLHPEINVTGYDKISYLINDTLRTTTPVNTLINKNYNFIIVEINN